MEKLKPCPFCGNEAEINGRDRLHYWFAQCIECGATQYGKETKEEAIEAWNRRTERSEDETH